MLILLTPGPACKIKTQYIKALQTGAQEPGRQAPKPKDQFGKRPKNKKSLKGAKKQATPLKTSEWASRYRILRCHCKNIPIIHPTLLAPWARGHIFTYYPPHIVGPLGPGVNIVDSILLALPYQGWIFQAPALQGPTQIKENPRRKGKRVGSFWKVHPTLPNSTNICPPAQNIHPDATYM